MLSFYKISESMTNKDYEESKAVEAIRNGINLDENFWENFMSVCNNAEVVSALLNVPREKVSGWSAKISGLLSQIDSMDNTEDHSQSKVKKKMLSTGMNNEFEKF